eukprot:scaffold12738_cov81-Phaeocystis_antarctica.AAC.5
MGPHCAGGAARSHPRGSMIIPPGVQGSFPPKEDVQYVRYFPGHGARYIVQYGLAFRAGAVCRDTAAFVQSAHSSWTIAATDCLCRAEPPSPFQANRGAHTPHQGARACTRSAAGANQERTFSFPPRGLQLEAACMLRDSACSLTCATTRHPLGTPGACGAGCPGSRLYAHGPSH